MNRNAVVALLTITMTRMLMVWAGEPVFIGGTYDTRELKLFAIPHDEKTEKTEKQGAVLPFRVPADIFSVSVKLKDSKGVLPPFSFTVEDLRKYRGLYDSATFDIVYLESLKCYQITGKDKSGKFVYSSQQKIGGDDEAKSVKGQKKSSRPKNEPKKPEPKKTPPKRQSTDDGILMVA